MGSICHHEPSPLVTSSPILITTKEKQMSLSKYFKCLMCNLKPRVFLPVSVYDNFPSVFKKIPSSNIQSVMILQITKAAQRNAKLYHIFWYKSTSLMLVTMIVMFFKLCNFSYVVKRFPCPKLRDMFCPTFLHYSLTHNF